MKACPYCGTENPDEAEVCSNCTGNLKVGGESDENSSAKTVISSAAAAEVEAMVAAAETAKEEEEAEAAANQAEQVEGEPVDEPVAESADILAQEMATDATSEPEAEADDAGGAKTIISSGAARELEEAIAAAEREVEQEQPESAFDRAEAILDQGSAPDVQPVAAEILPDEPKNKALALGLELLGLILLPGFGWMYAGNLKAGIGILIGSLILNSIFFVLDIFIGPFTLFLFLCCHALVILGIAGGSVYFLNNHIKAQPDNFI